MLQPIDELVLCIGCGCSDEDACEQGCRWIEVDRQKLRGVCSNCCEHLLRFRAGDYTLSKNAQAYYEIVKGHEC